MHRASPAADLRVHAALLAVQLMFGAFHVAAKALLGTLDPLAVACFRVLLATPALLWIAWRRDRLVPPRRELVHLAVLGLLGVFANQLLFILGLERTTATDAAILMPSIPVFTVVIGVLLGVQGVGPRRLAGVALAVAGALVLLDPRQPGRGTGASLGNLLILANCLSYAAFLVLQRPVLQRLPWRTVIAWAFAFGGLGVLAVGGRQLAAVDLAALSAATWLGLGYLGLVATALGYALATWAVRRSSPLLVAAYTTLQPLCTAVLAAVFLGEAMGWREAAGFALIASGLWAVSAAAGRRRGGEPAGP